jgi:hypothetical protein
VAARRTFAAASRQSGLAGRASLAKLFTDLKIELNPGTRLMNPQLRTVTIAQDANGGIRAWSDELAGLSLTCPNYEVLFTELTPKIASLLEQQGFYSKVVREIHQYVVEVRAIQG